MAFNLKDLLAKGKKTVSTISDTVNPFDKDFRSNLSVGANVAKTNIVNRVVKPVVNEVKALPQQFNNSVVKPIVRGYNSPSNSMENFTVTKSLYGAMPNQKAPSPRIQKIQDFKVNTPNKIVNAVGNFGLGLVKPLGDTETMNRSREALKVSPELRTPEQNRVAKEAGQNVGLFVAGATNGVGKKLPVTPKPQPKNLIKDLEDAVIKPKTTTTQPSPQLPQPTTKEIGLSQSSQINIPTTQANASFDVNNYINKQKVSQKASEGKTGLIPKAKTFLQDVKTKLVDSNAPIEDVLTKAEKQGKFKVIPTNDIRYQIDRVLRSDSIASQSLKESGIDKVIRSVDDVDAFNQYLIAKQAKDVSTKGITTGRNLVDDDAFINTVAQKYEPLAQQVYAHNRKMLDTLVDSGMISKELSDQLKKEYPNYVPLNRIFSEAEQSTMTGMGKSSAVASVGTQKTVKRLKGSERDIENPLESILTKTSQVFEQAEKNKAAKMLASYKDLPNNPFNLEEVVGTKSPGEATISFFDNGVKRVFKTDPEIANAAKNMSQQQIGLLGQFFAIPTRLLKLGATGLNLPFVASNLVKDQVFATINSNRALSTSLANPLNFAKSLFETFKHGQVYDDWVKSGASFTSFDLSRNSAKPTVEALRAGRNVGSRVLYTVKHPQSFIKTLEDAIGKSEEVTRIQQFNGMRDKLIKEGRTLEDATILAADAARSNTANFARRGEWGTVLNAAIPYLNAGIQGARSLTTNIAKNPVSATFKIAGLVFTPVAMATAWNLKDPRRKEAYNDIPEYEKEGNIIIIPENPVQDENGRWNAIKIPLTPGLSNLSSILRRQIEGIDNFDTESFMRVAGDLLTAGTSINPLDTNQTLTQLTPQGLKPAIESATNKNLFTGQSIVPEYMKNMPNEMQVKKNTSGTAKIIGGLTGSSPLKVENTIRTAGGGVGQQLLNASDQILAKAGKISPNEVGGKSVTESFANRFTSAAGGQKLNNLFEKKDTKTTKSGDVIEQGGKFWVKTGDTPKSFDSREEADKAVEKYSFEKSGEKYKEINGTFYYRDKNNKVQDKPISEIKDKKYELDYTLGLEKAKDADDYKWWKQIQTEYKGKLIKEYEGLDENNPLDALRMVEIENKVGDINRQVSKFDGYGGSFKKAKKIKLYNPLAEKSTTAQTYRNLQQLLAGTTTGAPRSGQIGRKVQLRKIAKG